MLPFQNYYSPKDGFLYQSVSAMMDMDGGGGGASSTITSEKKSAAACKSHSEAERRRRERINGHLRTLRTLLPNTTKTDKASLLAEVVQQVRELKKVAAEADVAAGQGDRPWEFPNEIDELRLSYCTESYRSESGETGEGVMIKVVMCCDDRAELLTELTQVMRAVEARVVKAEMATVGGRTKNEFVIEVRGGGGGEGEDVLSMLKRELKSVVEKPAGGLSASGQVVFGNKRPRLTHPIY